MGAEAKHNDVDKKGTKVQMRYDITVNSDNGRGVSFAMTCFHTTNSMMLQLLGDESAEKLRCMANFAQITLKDLIEKVEKTVNYRRMMESMQTKLNMLLLKENRALQRGDEMVQVDEIIDILVPAAGKIGAWEIHGLQTAIETSIEGTNGVDEPEIHVKKHVKKH